MGNTICCCVPPPEVSLDDLVLEEDVLNSIHVVTRNDKLVEYFSPPLVEEFFLAKQTAQNHHRWGRLQISKPMESLSEVEQYSEQENRNIENNAVDWGGDQIESWLGSSTDGSISALEELLVMTSDTSGMNENEKYCQTNDRNSYKSLIRLQDETNKVIGAGSTAANGVYRWFAAHGRFVMFTDEGQYQIRGGVNLSEYGDRYYDSWVIEEIRENVVPLYAVPSNNSITFSSDVWICINGVPPAPKVEGGDDRELYEEDGCMEAEESASIYPMQLACLSMPLDENYIDEISEIEWVA